MDQNGSIVPNDMKTDMPISNFNSSPSEVRFEKQSQHFIKELSLNEMSQILINNWPLFTVLLFISVTISILFYSVAVPYVSSTSIIVNDIQNSSLQMFAGQQAGTIRSTDGKKNNLSLNKHLEYFKTEEFYSILINDIEKRASDNKITLAEKSGYDVFKQRTSNMKPLDLFKYLDSAITFKIKSDYDLRISTATDNKELSLFITNTAIATAKRILTDREMDEVGQIEKFIDEQKQLTENNVQDLNKKLVEFHNRPENLMSLTSASSVGNYLSDLSSRKSEIRMKIAENTKLIQYLGGERSNTNESQLYGSRGRIHSIQMENEVLRSKLDQIQVAIGQASKEAKALPLASQTYEQLKKKSEIELNRLKELSDSLSKAQAQKLAISTKFEILEKARFDKVAPEASLTTLILCSIILSQMLGVLIIYLTTIWDSNTVTAQTSRNVVVIDSHSIDPRVIMENSKIKFRLKNNLFDDPESGESKKIGFDFKLLKEANGDTE